MAACSSGSLSMAACLATPWCISTLTRMSGSVLPWCCSGSQGAAGVESKRGGWGGKGGVSGGCGGGAAGPKRAAAAGTAEEADRQHGQRHLDHVNVCVDVENLQGSTTEGASGQKQFPTVSHSVILTKTDIIPLPQKAVRGEETRQPAPPATPAPRTFLKEAAKASLCSLLALWPTEWMRVPSTAQCRKGGLLSSPAWRRGGGRPLGCGGRRAAGGTQVIGERICRLILHVRTIEADECGHRGGGGVLGGRREGKCGRSATDGCRGDE